MFGEDYEIAAQAAEKKVRLLKKRPGSYLMLSIIAGMFIGIGVLLAFTIGAQTSGMPYCKILMGGSFSAALSLVVFAGAELFTGNNMVAAIGVFNKKIKVGDMLLLWLVCYFGNLIGSMIMGGVYHVTGLGNGIAGETMAMLTVTKTSATALQLFARGILCNMLVCLGVWCGFRCKTEIGKLVMIFWCILAFFVVGFEHSVANMTLFFVALLNPCGQPVALTDCLFNLAFVTLGNIVGGVLFVALPYKLAGYSAE